MEAISKDLTKEKYNLNIRRYKGEERGDITSIKWRRRIDSDQYDYHIRRDNRNDVAYVEHAKKVAKYLNTLSHKQLKAKSKWIRQANLIGSSTVPESASRKSQKKAPVQTGETLDGGMVKHTCPKCSREFIYTTKRTAAASFSNHARNCKGAERSIKKRRASIFGKRRKRVKAREGDDEDDLEDKVRDRLENAKLAAVSTIFLPTPGNIGVGKFSLSNNKHVHSMSALHNMITTKTERGMSWGEGGQNEDPRRKMYAFPLGRRKALLDEGILVQKEGAKDNQEHENTLMYASVDLAFCDEYKSNIKTTNHPPIVLFCDPCIRETLQDITNRVHDLVPKKYKRFVTYNQLIAAQPNLHNGARHLPLHLDFPRNDGFGVVIVTIVIRGSGWIVLLDEGDEDDDAPQSHKFFLEEGEAYILCGDARNKCLHGVWCDSNSKRETLNLRYGLHSAEFANEECLKYWR